jgi:hypothetical protein
MEQAQEKTPKVIAIDFETFYTSKYSLTSMIPEEYCADDRFDAYLLSSYDGENTWVGSPKDYDWSQLEGCILLAHNRRFEHCVLNELVKRGIIPPLPKWKEFHCTANLTSWYCNKRPLKDAVKHIFGKHVSKGARTDMKDKQWKDISAKQQEEMREYAKGDVIYCRDIWMEIGHLWPQVERDLANLTIDQGMYGVAIDEKLLEYYLHVTREAMAATVASIPWSGERAPSSPHGVAAECRKVGIPCPPVKGEDAEGHALWENTYVDKFPWVKGVSAYRSLAKLVKTFETVERRIRPDGTMPFSLKYFGAHTGRWSGDGKLNMQNPRKDALLINQEGFMETDSARCKAAIKEERETGKYPDWVKHSVNFRHLIIPRKGKKMIVADLEQIEPRVLAWMVDDEDFLKLIRKGISPYEAFARKNGWEGGKLKNEDPGRYALSKIQVLGLGYGCGWRKFITIADSYDINLTKDDPEIEVVVDPLTQEEKEIDGFGKTSRAIVKAFRDASPKITALWKQLDAKFKSSVGEDFTMTLPSGRVQTYHRVKRECRMVPDPTEKDPHRMKGKWIYTAQVGYKRESLYGGLLTENAVQAIARDAFGFIMLRLHQLGYRVLFSCHDEVILEVPIDVEAEVISEEMKVIPEWLDGCPVSAEASEVKHYTK